jgi:hypothetical protein
MILAGVSYTIDLFNYSLYNTLRYIMKRRFIFDFICAAIRLYQNEVTP